MRTPYTCGRGSTRLWSSAIVVQIGLAVWGSDNNSIELLWYTKMRATYFLFDFNPSRFFFLRVSPLWFLLWPIRYMELGEQQKHFRFAYVWNEVRPPQRTRVNAPPQQINIK